MQDAAALLCLLFAGLQLIDYEQLLGQFWSDGTADRGSWIPMRLEKYASKTERSGTKVPVGIVTDEDTRSLVVYFSRECGINKPI